MSDNFLQFSAEIDATEEQGEWLLSRIQEIDDAGEHICEAEIEHNKGIWLYASDHGNVEGVASLVVEFQEIFEITEPFTLSYAYTCSKPRVDEFGGGAVVVHRGKTHWFDASTMAHRLLQKLREEDEQKACDAGGVPSEVRSPDLGGTDTVGAGEAEITS